MSDDEEERKKKEEEEEQRKERAKKDAKNAKARARRAQANRFRDNQKNASQAYRDRKKEQKTAKMAMNEADKQQTRTNDSVEPPRDVQARNASDSNAPSFVTPARGNSTPHRASSNQQDQDTTPIRTPEGVDSEEWRMMPPSVKKVVTSAKKQVSTLEATNRKLERRVDEGHEMAKSLTRSVESAIEVAAEVGKNCSSAASDSAKTTLLMYEKVLQLEASGQNGVDSDRDQDVQRNEGRRRRGTQERYDYHEEYSSDDNDDYNVPVVQDSNARRVQSTPRPPPPRHRTGGIADSTSVAERRRDTNTRPRQSILSSLHDDQSEEAETRQVRRLPPRHGRSVTFQLPDARQGESMPRTPRRGRSVSFGNQSQDAESPFHGRSVSFEVESEFGGDQHTYDSQDVSRALFDSSSVDDGGWFDGNVNGVARRPPAEQDDDQDEAYQASERLARQLQAQERSFRGRSFRDDDDTNDGGGGKMPAVTLKKAPVDDRTDDDDDDRNDGGGKMPATEDGGGKPAAVDARAVASEEEEEEPNLSAATHVGSSPDASDSCSLVSDASFELFQHYGPFIGGDFESRRRRWFPDEVSSEEDESSLEASNTATAPSAVAEASSQGSQHGVRTLVRSGEEETETVPDVVTETLRDPLASLAISSPEATNAAPTANDSSTVEDESSGEDESIEEGQYWPYGTQPPPPRSSVGDDSHTTLSSPVLSLDGGSTPEASNAAPTAARSDADAAPTATDSSAEAVQDVEQEYVLVNDPGQEQPHEDLVADDSAARVETNAATAPPVVEKEKCSKTVIDKDTGEPRRCKINAKPGSRYCGMHQR